MKKHEKYIQYLKDFGEMNLLESFGPIQTNYGSDLTNEKWLIIKDSGEIKVKKGKKQLNGRMIYTFTEINNLYYQVYFLNNDTNFEFGFAVSQHFSFELVNDLKFLERFHRNPIGLSNAYSVFNRIMFILLEFIKKQKPNILTFSGSDMYLDKIYRKLIKQNKMQEIFKEIEYSYIGEKNNYFIFKRNI